jgi:phosphonate transport system permease protein
VSDADHREVDLPPPPALPPRPLDRFRLGFSLLAAAIVVWSVVSIDVKWGRLLEAPGDLYTLSRVLFGNLDGSALADLLAAMVESISIAWLGTLIATVFAAPLAFVAAENLVGRWAASAVRQVLNLLRAIPDVILALAFIPLLGLTPMAGVMAIGLGSIGTLGKLFYEIIEAIQPGPLEAADAVGANRIQRLRWGVLPQVLPELASFVLYRFEVNIRASAVLGLVGAGGIGSDLAQALRFKDYPTAGLGLIIVVVGTVAVDVVSGAIRRRIVAGRPMDTAALEAGVIGS